MVSGLGAIRRGSLGWYGIVAALQVLVGILVTISTGWKWTLALFGIFLVLMGLGAALLAHFGRRLLRTVSTGGSRKASPFPTNSLTALGLAAGVSISMALSLSGPHYDDVLHALVLDILTAPITGAHLYTVVISRGL